MMMVGRIFWDDHGGVGLGTMVVAVVEVISW